MYNKNQILPFDAPCQVIALRWLFSLCIAEAVNRQWWCGMFREWESSVECVCVCVCVCVRVCACVGWGVAADRFSKFGRSVLMLAIMTL